MIDEKDENGAILVGRYHGHIKGSPKLEKHAEGIALHGLAIGLGNAILEHFPAEKSEESIPTEASPLVKYQQEVVVMSVEDYNKLADYKWMYEGLQ